MREMVSGALQYSQANFALAVSGIAGPGGGTSDKPVGTVWFAWSIKAEASNARVYYLNGNREEIREQAVRIALEGVLDQLKQRAVIT